MAHAVPPKLAHNGSRFVEPLSLYDVELCASHFSPPSPNHSIWTNTATLQSCDVERGRSSMPRSSSFRDRMSKWLSTRQERQPKLPMQELHRRSQLPPYIERGENKLKRDKLLFILLIVVLLYLFVNDIILNASTVKLWRAISALTDASRLSPSAEQCVQQFTTDAPSNPSGYPCAQCFPVLEEEVTQPNVMNNSVYDTQQVHNVLQFCGLRALFDGTNPVGQASLSYGNWVKDVNFCDWHGVGCAINDTVTSLEIGYPAAPSLIPTEIGGLTGLQNLSLFGNSVFPTGHLPNSFAQLTSLKSLELSATAIAPIPINILAKNITRLVFVNNTNMLPNLLFTLPDIPLQILEVDAQSLIPGSINALSSKPSIVSSLTSLTLHFNDMSDTIPDSIISFDKLTHLDLSYNNLSSSLPSLPSSITSLVILDNALLNGTIPSAICNLPSCSLSGTAVTATGSCNCRL